MAPSSLGERRLERGKALLDLAHLMIRARVRVRVGLGLRSGGRGLTLTRRTLAEMGADQGREGQVARCWAPPIVCAGHGTPATGAASAHQHRGRAGGTHLPGERVDFDHLTVEVLAARDEAPPLGHTDAHGLRCVLRRVTIRAHVLRRVEREL